MPAISVSIFQITDDLLDELGTAEKTGKTVGKDKNQGKATLVSLLGVQAAREKAEMLARRAASTVAPLWERSPPASGIAVISSQSRIVNPMVFALDINLENP